MADVSDKYPMLKGTGQRMFILSVRGYPSKTEERVIQQWVSETGKHPTTMVRDGGQDPEYTNEVHSLLQSDLGVQLPLHISLSAPLVLQTKQRVEFEEVFEKAVQTARIDPFHVQCVGLDWVSNQEKTRFFLVLRLARPDGDELNKLLNVSNACADRFGVPILYDVPQDRGSYASKRHRPGRVPPPKTRDHSGAYHISIAWRLTEPSDEESRMVAKFDLGEIKDLIIRFDVVNVKIGNSVRPINLVASYLHQ